MNKNIKIVNVPKVDRLCDEIGDLRKKKVNIGDVKLYVEEQAGNGKLPLLMINGGPGGTHHDFHPTFDNAKKFACRVIYYDQRGCGLSGYNPENKKYSVTQAVDDIDRLRKKLGIKKWVVLGYSYGGYLAQLYAIGYPEKVAGIVLVNASPGFGNGYLGNRQEQRKTNEEKGRIAKIRDMQDLDDVTRLYNLYLNGDWKRQYYKKPNKLDLARDMVYGWSHDKRFRREMFARKWLILRKAFEKCPIPTIIFEGEHDLTWGAEKKNAIKENHPGAKMVLMKKSAHVSFVDETRRFFAELGTFFKKIDQKEIDVNGWKKYLVGWKKRQKELEKKEQQLNRDCMEKYFQNLDKEKYTIDWKDIDEAWHLWEIAKAKILYKKYKDADKILKGLMDYTGSKEKEMLFVVYSFAGILLDLQKDRDGAKIEYQKACNLNCDLVLGVDELDVEISNKWLKKVINEGLGKNKFMSL